MASPVKNNKLFKRVTPKPDTPPVVATPEGIGRAEQLQYTRMQVKKLRDDSWPPSLEAYRKVFDKDRSSTRNQNQTSGEGKGMRNPEFLVALILENEVHVTSLQTGGCSRQDSHQAQKVLRCKLPLRCQALHLMQRST